VSLIALFKSEQDEPIYSIVGGFHLWQAGTETPDLTIIRSSVE
jgi:hypothetical protein